VVHLKRDLFDVRIDRASKLGNPFKIGQDGSRAEVIAKHRKWLFQQADLLTALRELRGKRLGCWCAPQPCHGDTLAELANGQLGLPTSPSCSACGRDHGGRIPWHAIGPADAVDIDLAVRLDIDAPLGVEGERCPWPWEPQQLVGVPLGQYPCKYCGTMVVAGFPHLDYRDDGDGLVPPAL